MLLLKPREVVPLTLHCQGFALRIELKLNLGVETWEMAFRIISECPESLLSANRQGKDVLGASSVFQCTVSSFQCFVLQDLCGCVSYHPLNNSVYLYLLQKCSSRVGTSTLANAEGFQLSKVFFCLVSRVVGSRSC